MNFGLYIGESTGLRVFENLIKKKINIKYVCTIDKSYKSKISSLCKKNSIPFFFNPKNNIKKILDLSANIDYLLSVFSRFIIPNKILSLTKIYSLNVHPGLLPHYPGTNSISGSLYNDEKFSGISIHLITKKIDTGDICLIKKIKIKKNELAINLWLRIMSVTPKVINKLISNLIKKKIFLYKNDLNQKKIFPNFIPNKGKINKNIKKKELLKMYRASYYEPFKSTWGNLNFIYKKKKYYIKKLEPTTSQIKYFIKKIKSKKFIINVENDKFVVIVR